MLTILDYETIASRIINGFDYLHQAWVKDGRSVRCGHPDWMECNCYGRLHENESTEPTVFIEV